MKKMTCLQNNNNNNNNNNKRRKFYFTNACAVSEADIFLIRSKTTLGHDHSSGFTTKLLTCFKHKVSITASPT